jgi:hypothetical protein
MKLSLAAIASVVAAGVALAQSPDGAPPAAGRGAAGCQPGQVLQADGESCLPPVAVPTPTMNALVMTPAAMSRMLSPAVSRSVASSCQAGQVLQANGQPCLSPSGGR